MSDLVNLSTEVNGSVGIDSDDVVKNFTASKVRVCAHGLISAQCPAFLKTLQDRGMPSNMRLLKLQTSALESAGNPWVALLRRSEWRRWRSVSCQASGNWNQHWALQRRTRALLRKHGKMDMLSSPPIRSFCSHTILALQSDRRKDDRQLPRPGWTHCHSWQRGRAHHRVGHRGWLPLHPHHRGPNAARYQRLPCWPALQKSQSKSLSVMP